MYISLLMLSRQCVIKNEPENHRGLEIVQINAFIWIFAVESAKPFRFNESTLQHTAIVIEYRSCEYMCIGEKTTVMHTHFPLSVRFHSRFYIYRHCVTCCVSSFVCVNNYLVLTLTSFSQFTDELFQTWWWWRRARDKREYHFVLVCIYLPFTFSLNVKKNARTKTQKKNSDRNWKWNRKWKRNKNKQFV